MGGAVVAGVDVGGAANCIRNFCAIWLCKHQCCRESLMVNLEEEWDSYLPFHITIYLNMD